MRCGMGNAWLKENKVIKWFLGQRRQKGTETERPESFLHSIINARYAVPLCCLGKGWVMHCVYRLGIIGLRHNDGDGGVGVVVAAKERWEKLRPRAKQIINRITEHVTRTRGHKLCTFPRLHFSRRAEKYAQGDEGEESNPRKTMLWMATECWKEWRTTGEGRRFHRTLVSDRPSFPSPDSRATDSDDLWPTIYNVVMGTYYIWAAPRSVSAGHKKGDEQQHSGKHQLKRGRLMKTLNLPFSSENRSESHCTAIVRIQRKTMAETRRLSWFGWGWNNAWNWVTHRNKRDTRWLHLHVVVKAGKRIHSVMAITTIIKSEGSFKY